MTFRQWLHRRLFDPNERIMLAVYSIILVALVTFVVLPNDVPRWQFYGTVITLILFLAANMAWLTEDDDDNWASSRNQFSQRLYLWVGAGLVLLANGFGMGTEHATFLPYLLFPLVGQAVVILNNPLRATLYSAVLLAGWLLVIWLKGAPVDELGQNAIQIGMGMVFTALISTVAVRYSEQTARANALLQELRATNTELEMAREREKSLAVSEERVRLAREIHDGLGHHLTVLSVQLQAAAKLIERDPERTAATITTCQEVAQAALAEVRRSVAAMRQSPLDNRTLDEAISKLVEDFDRYSPIDARFEQHGPSALLPAAATMTLYRAVQEGLTNAQKHAEAKRATVSLQFTPDAVALHVWNDGDPSALPHQRTNGSGFGLAGLRERAEQLGGSFAAGWQPDGGFLLQLALPLEGTGYDSHLAGG